MPAAAMALRAVDDVIEREVAGEVFLVPIRGRLADLHDLFVLNEVGRWLWRRLDGSQSVDALVAGVVEEFEVDDDRARADVDAFLNELQAAGLAEEALS